MHTLAGPEHQERHACRKARCRAACLRLPRRGGVAGVPQQAQERGNPLALAGHRASERLHHALLHQLLEDAPPGAVSHLRARCQRSNPSYA